MDPVAAIGAANATNTALRTAVGATQAAWRRFRLWGTLDTEWLRLASDDDDSLASLKLEDIADIQSFLCSERLRPVLNFLAVALLSPASEDQDELVNAIRATFDNEVTRWNISSSRKWSQVGNAVWTKINDIYQGNLPILHRDPAVRADLEQLNTFVSTPLSFTPNDPTKPPAHLSRLLEMTSDLDALIVAARTADEIAGLLRSAGHQPMITHADVPFPVEFARLYVERTIERLDTRETLNAATLISSGDPFRYVLIGSPGAGKTTFMRHLVVTLANSNTGNPTIPACTVRCRDYVSKGWARSLLEYSAAHLSAELSIDLLQSALESLLMLGKIVTIFDGLDEVTEVTQRSVNIQQVHSAECAGGMG